MQGGGRGAGHSQYDWQQPQHQHQHAPARTLRTPHNAGAGPLQGFREDYHGHGPDGELEHDEDIDAEGSDDEVAQALQGQGQHMYHYAGGGGNSADEMLYDDYGPDEGDRLGGDSVGVGPDGNEVEGDGMEEDLDDDEEDAAGEFSDSLSSSPSIPDDDIDFNLVYALHTFLATVDGQASVVKGDKLLLLDDSNSYWWLVRVLKTQAIGYIPAENIETPWERLARLNKHRNVDLTTATQHDVLTGPTSSSAQTRFAGRIPPSKQPPPHESRHPFAKGIPASPSHKDHPRNISPPRLLDDLEAEDGGLVPRPPSSKAKTVLFTAPTYYAHSATGMTSEEDPDDPYYEDHELDGEEVEEGEEEGLHHGEGDGEGDGDGRPDFQDDHGHDDDELHHDVSSGARKQRLRYADEPETHLHEPENDADEEDADQGDSSTLVLGQPDPSATPNRGDLPAALVPGGGASPARAGGVFPGSDKPDSSALQDPVRAPLQPLNRPLEASPIRARTSSGTGLGIGFEAGGERNGGPGPGLSTAASDPTLRSSAARTLGNSLSSSTLSREFNENELLDPEAPTKKLSVTPAIAREQNRGPVSSQDGHAVAGRDFAGQTDAAAQADRPKRTVRGVDLVDPRDPRYNRMLQPTRQAGEDLVYERVVADAQRQQQAYEEEQYQLQQQRQQQQQQQGLTSPPRGMYETPDLHDEDVGDGLGDSTGSRRASGSVSGAEGASGSEKKRKSGGGILSLFRKKDKKKKGADKDDSARTSGAGNRPSDESLRSSTSSGGAAFRRSTSGSPSGFRSSTERPNGSSGARNVGAAPTAESMFSTDAALRQQELEAKQALFHQYGVSRAPGDVSNTMTPRGAPGGLVMDHEPAPNDTNTMSGVRLSASGSTNSNRNSLSLLSHPASMLGSSAGLGTSAAHTSSMLAPPQRARPGSLLGSPNMSGAEVPVLSVMRVFAGDHVDSEATFKTVLLNQSTSSAELVKQAMQRFRLIASQLRPEDFYLTVKELGGDERVLEAVERPLEIFEGLSERIGEDGLALPPNVKRSSIGSINSISSNLTLNPAITRSGVGDWSDDSAVKFYLHRRGRHGETGDLDLSGGSLPLAQSISGSAADDSTNLSSDPDLSTALRSSFPSGPSYRFAVKLLLYPTELPETVAFDPNSEAVIPKALLAEREQRLGDSASDPTANGPRQRILFFPRNANVSEVVETALDRFGIADGIVDGGDEVEDRVTRRRSGTRVKYGLAVEKEGQELILPSSSKLLEAYEEEPAFKAYDRSSREFRRRSADASLILGTASDIRPTDPVFIIRRSPNRSSGTRGLMPQTVDELDKLRHGRRVSSEKPGGQLRGGEPGRPRSSQRTVSRQLEGRGAEEVGIGSRTAEVGSEPDMQGLRPTETFSRGASASTTTDADSFLTAQTHQSRTPLASPGAFEADEEAAIARLRNAEVSVSPPITMDTGVRPSTPAGDSALDPLAESQPHSPTGLDESLQQRLDRVLARVREDKARRKGSQSGAQRPLSYVDPRGAGGGSGRFSPVNVAARSASALGSHLPSSSAKLSDSPSIDHLMSVSHPPFGPRPMQHGKKTSLASVSSANSQTTGTDQLSTQLTPSNAHSTGYTPASSATSHPRAPLVYPASLGYDYLEAVVTAQARLSPERVRAPASRPFYERTPDVLAEVHSDVRASYEEPARALDDLEKRLDELLLRTIRV